MRIQVLSASVGAGHVRAAEAVEVAVRGLGADITVANHDVLTFMPPAVRKVYRDGYFELVKHAPRLLGWLYEKTDKPFHSDRVRLKLHTLAFKVRSVLEQPGRLAAMRKNALRAARPDAGAVIARFATSQAALG